jgi:hypothetical protein
MLKQKIYNIVARDELVLHKVGLIFGAVLGVVAGLFISDRALQFQEIIEEVSEDGDATIS